MSQLPAPTRRLLLAVALCADLRVSHLVALADPPAIDDALDAGILLVDGDRVRSSHPLLAAAAKRHSRAAEQRALHLELASAVTDEGLRARHLALATAHPETELAGSIAVAAATAVARGAAEDAVALAEHALRLTPPDAPERTDRLLVLAEYMLVAGEPQGVADLLRPELERLPRGRTRGRAHLLLADSGDVSDADAYLGHLERALAVSDGDATVRAMVLANKAVTSAVAFVGRIRDAEAWALEALPAARAAGPEVERLALHGLAWTRILRSDAAAVRRGAELTRLAAAELTREGTPVRYLRSIFVPEDETCFYLDEAADAEAVREAATRAAVPFERVAELLTNPEGV